MSVDPKKLPSVRKRIDHLESSITEIERCIRSYSSSVHCGPEAEEGGEGARGRKDSLVIEENGRIVEYGASLPKIFGTEDDLTGKDINSYIDAPEGRKFLETVRLLGPGDSRTFIGLHARGFEVPLKVFRENGAGDERAGTLQLRVEDRSCRETLEAELDESRESYHVLAETASDVIILIGFDFTIQFANSAVQRIFGYSSDELEGRSVGRLFPDSRYKNYEELIQKYFFIDDTHRKESGMGNTIEVLGRTKEGELVPLEISFGNSKGLENNRVLTCIVRDIALRKKAERRLKFLAYHDKLTSLGNRDRLTETIGQLLAEIGRESGRKAALMFLDLDGFKKVNDSLGHEMGDLILKESARRLSNCIRQEDNVYRIQMEDIFRLGGDEFTVLLPRIRKPEEAAVVANRIIEKILEPFNIEGYGAISDISMGVSVGIALIPDDGNDKTTILRNADAAMYKAKEIGNTYVFFTKDMNNKAMERLMLEEGLRKSIGKQDFKMFYQPIVDKNGVTKGFEALVRWNHPEKGLIMPKKFSEVAEDTRLILPIGKWVFEAAARHMKRILSKGIDDIYMSINVSPVQLEKEDLSDMISQVLNKVGLDPKYIVLELTETSLMEDPESAIAKMETIVGKNKGIKIAVDDFGTGYSSLGYLSLLPVEILKIDRTFVMNLSSESSNIKIINSILGLGKSLNLEIIAEGVETREQLDFLVERDCTSFQGFLFSEALPFKQALEYLRV
jgi:diguanylate cyclase (GGDEF)-like protein/PAS domain S-box-containing protein